MEFQGLIHFEGVDDNRRFLFFRWFFKRFSQFFWLGVSFNLHLPGFWLFLTSKPGFLFGWLLPGNQEAQNGWGWGGGEGWHDSLFKVHVSGWFLKGSIKETSIQVPSFTCLRCLKGNPKESQPI